MNFKTTYILFGLLGAVLVVFAVVLWLNPLPPEVGDYVLPSLHRATSPVTTSDVTEVIIDRRRPTEEKWVFVKDETSRFGLPSFKVLGASWATYAALRERLGPIPDGPLTHEGLQSWASSVRGCRPLFDPERAYRRRSNRPARTLE